jgi:hypothetical protein
MRISPQQFRTASASLYLASGHPYQPPIAVVFILASRTTTHQRLTRGGNTNLYITLQTVVRGQTWTEIQSRHKSYRQPCLVLRHEADKVPSEHAVKKILSYGTQT